MAFIETLVNLVLQVRFSNLKATAFVQLPIACLAASLFNRGGHCWHEPIPPVRARLKVT